MPLFTIHLKLANNKHLTEITTNLIRTKLFFKDAV